MPWDRAQTYNYHLPYGMILVWHSKLKEEGDLFLKETLKAIGEFLVELHHADLNNMYE